MAETVELAIAICRLIEASPTPVPVTLMNHSVEEAAAVIAAVVEQCQTADVKLAEVCVDPELAVELGLKAGVVLPHGARPTVRIQDGLGRNILFGQREIDLGR